MGLQLFEFSWAILGWLTTSFVTLVCLVWLLRATPRSALRNAFAILLFILFLTTGPLLALLYVQDGRTYWPFELGDNMIGLAALLFLVTWLASQRGTRLPRWLPVPFVLGMLATAVLWMLEPSLRFETTDGTSKETIHAGFLLVVEQLLDSAMAVTISVLFLRQAVRRDSVASALAGFGFLAFALVDGSGGFIDVLRGTAVTG